MSFLPPNQQRQSTEGNGCHLGYNLHQWQHYLVMRISASQTILCQELTFFSSTLNRLFEVWQNIRSITGEFYTQQCAIPYFFLTPGYFAFSLTFPDLFQFSQCIGTLLTTHHRGPQFCGRKFKDFSETFNYLFRPILTMFYHIGECLWHHIKPLITQTWYH